MTLSELMLGSMQSVQDNTVMQLGSRTAQKTGNSNSGPAFGDILESKVSAADRQSGMRRNYSASAGKDSGPAEAVQGSKTKFQTYREACENRRAISSGSSAARGTKAANSADSEPDKVKEDSKKRAAGDNSSNSMVQALAQLLGIDVRDLRKLMEQAGISEDSFNNLDGINENVSKLSQLLGLDSEQGDTLAKLLGMAGQALNIAQTAVESDEQSGLLQETAGSGAEAGSSKSAVNASEAVLSKLKEADGSSGNAAGSSEIDELLAKLDAKIKIRLDNLGNRLEKHPASVQAELKQMLAQLTDKTAFQNQGALQEANEANAGTAVEETAAAASDESQAENDDGKRAGVKSDKQEVIQQTAAASKETQSQPVFAAVQSGKASNAEAVEKAAAIKPPVEPKEIIRQVIEKAKVILTPDKSEMIMDLKPDSLGKISIKVVNENGMVMAKFVADSEQVKQVLETNMQLLKDSLEKQGMNVQGFSVSVRQESDRSAERWTQAENSRNRGAGGTEYRTAGIEGITASTARMAIRNNPYAWGGSTIDFTA